MEDLSVSYSHIPNRKLLDEHQIQLLLRSIANMHAASINYDMNIGTNKIGDEFKDFLFETAHRKENSWFSAGLEV